MAIDVNEVYTKVLSILNKESRGFLTPGEFNNIGSQVQLESLGRTGEGYANIPKKIQDKIDPFYATESISLTSGVGTLPTFYNIINISADSRLTQLERIDKSKLSFLLSSPLTAPSSTFPIRFRYIT